MDVCGDTASRRLRLTSHWHSSVDAATSYLMATPVRRSSCATGAVVLLVQPERDDREMYAEYLSHMGLTPLCVQEAEAALRVAYRADVIVTGLLLPGPIDGYALIDRLRHS